MYTAIWGPYFWATLQLIAKKHKEDLEAFVKFRVEHAKDEEKLKIIDEREAELVEGLENFFKALPYILPCPGCMYHTREYINNHPPPLKDTENTNSLFEWIWEYHNVVNRQTGKREVTLEETETMYNERFRKRSTYIDIARAEQIRKEDHQKIEELENKLKAYESGETPDGAPSKKKIPTRLIFAVVSVVILIVVLFMIFK